MCCKRPAPMRFLPFSYFCTCWNVTPSPSASFSWLIPSIIRRIRIRLPTCLSTGLGDLFIAYFPIFFEFGVHVAKDAGRSALVGVWSRWGLRCAHRTGSMGTICAGGYTTSPVAAGLITTRTSSVLCLCDKGLICAASCRSLRSVSRPLSIHCDHEARWHPRWVARICARIAVRARHRRRAALAGVRGGTEVRWQTWVRFAHPKCVVTPCALRSHRGHSAARFGRPCTTGPITLDGVLG